MFSILPDLTPRDSHSLWYTPSRGPNAAFSSPFDASFSRSAPAFDNAAATGATAAANAAIINPATGLTTTTTTGAALTFVTNILNLNHNNNATTLSRGGGPPLSGPHRNHHLSGPAAAALLVERSALGRLRADEQLQARQRAAVANLGSTWLKPPGVGKTLFQMREERREAEEHAETVRREMLAQELAEMEAAAAARQAARAAQAAGAGGGGLDASLTGDDVMVVEVDLVDEDDEEGMRDLDEDIPDADEEGLFGYDGISDGEDEEDEDEEEEEEEVEEEEEEEAEHEVRGNTSRIQAQHQRRAQQREVANMRAAEDRMRQMMARGGPAGDAGADFYDGDEDIDEEAQGQLLDEDDLLSGAAAYSEAQADVEPGMDMDMDANLDDGIPEAASGAYEHTDSEASLSSDNGGHDVSYARGSQVLHQRNSHRRGDAPRSSLDISGFLSRDGSSIMGSSPHIRTANP